MPVRRRKRQSATQGLERNARNADTSCGGGATSAEDSLYANARWPNCGSNSSPCSDMTCATHWLLSSVESPCCARKPEHARGEVLNLLHGSSCACPASSTTYSTSRAAGSAVESVWMSRPQSRCSRSSSRSWESYKPPCRRLDRTHFSIPVAVPCDRMRIGQLVSNLLGNALTHGDKSQPIKFGGLLGRRIVLSVANAGVPIPQATVQRLFQPFVRGEGRCSQNGSGLGLRHCLINCQRARRRFLTVEVIRRGEMRSTFQMPLRWPASRHTRAGPLQPASLMSETCRSTMYATRAVWKSLNRGTRLLY